IYLLTCTSPPQIYILSLHDALPILRMIRLAAEIGIHQAGTVRMRGVALFWFERHEYGINFGEYFRIVAFEGPAPLRLVVGIEDSDRKSTRLNSSHVSISYAVFCLKK